MVGNDKKLFIVFQKYSAIFNKRIKYFHHKGFKENIWKTAARELAVENKKHCKKKNRLF